MRLIATLLVCLAVIGAGPGPAAACQGTYCYARPEPTQTTTDGAFGRCGNYGC